MKVEIRLLDLVAIIIYLANVGINIYSSNLSAVAGWLCALIAYVLFITERTL